MHINNIKLLSLSLLLLLSTTTFADKPSWAGEGGKPTKYEKREHKEDMTSKHEYKKQKKNKKHKESNRDDKDYDKDYDRNYDKDYSRDTGNVHVPNLIKEVEQQRHEDKVKIAKKVHETQTNWFKKLFHID